MRPGFPPRPLGIIPMPRPPVLGIRGPIIPPVVRPAIMPIVTPTEKPQTTVYVGKMASTVENDFMLSLLQLCGPVKSWKRPQDSTTGALRGFGFCEFESAEGVLRALRLLSKLNVDGQELMLNVDQVTKEHLERYVEKKKENVKNLKGTESEGVEKEEVSESGPEKNELPKPSEDSKEDKSDEANKENKDTANFGLVTDEDRQADQEASEKLSGMLEERLKTKPLPPPPPPPPQQAAADGSGNLELPARSKDGDSDVDIMRNDAGEDRNDEEMTSDSKPPSEHDRPETSSPDRGRRTDRRSRDRERDLKREKERELERYEREREQERAKRERERENKIREDERRYRARLKEWESREKEKERARKEEKEWEKEKELDRKYEVMDQERDSDDGYSKKRKYKSSGGEREERKRRQREREEDMADRVKEEEEIAEAKRRSEEERELQKEQEKHALELLSSRANSGTEKAVLPDVAIFESKEEPSDQMSDGDFVHGSSVGNGVIQNGSSDESAMEPLPTADARQSNSIPSRKLGFGLVGSGKRTAVPSVFHEEEDEDAQKEKKMRPLVPIDYSTEELQAVRDTTPPVAPSPNLAAAAEFAKRIGNVNSKEVRADSEKERSRRHNDRSSQRDRDRNGDESGRTRDESSRSRDESRKESDWDKDRDRADKAKTPENKKLMDAKQLIDTIPKTKDELFSYEINWSIYDKNGLHERMRPWISKKITEYLGEEEPTLVDYIVSTTGEHITATEMLKKLELILDDEAEMFVLKMWRMLIFEIKRVETGLASRSKA